MALRPSWLSYFLFWLPALTLNEQMNIQMRLSKLSITLDEAARKVKNDGHVFKQFNDLSLNEIHRYEVHEMPP